jgi:regulator of cell morphogenesis and NO signaling
MNTFLDKLREEHQHALRELAALHNTAVALREHGWSEDATARMRKAVTFINNDVRTHNEREEEYLFPELERMLPASGPTGVMRAEHRALWDALTSLEKELPLLQSDADAESLRSICSYAFAVAELLTNHISKEDNILFPMAERMLQPAQLEELENVMKRLFPRTEG